ncbi:ABC transporter ATP-binding protein [Halomonas cupida]|uniref:ABC transporter ATP-binding protein n=1 Tax=Halomonas cupida TaxID=44933 RepID=A0A1M7LAQ8_9GAMM|nr:ABC transporter ATP-binding protein [Halomonas cupida]GEN25192.1 ABC transporter ATP-binding protein [Halomonas cupida]SHM74884.1 iron complex transport system ATP-binding protein [Halomonas cupida]
MRLHCDALQVDIPGRAPSQPLSLTVEPGSRWGVLGPNGAGKTTLLHTLAGLRPAAAGQVVLGERPLAAWRRRQAAQHLGLVFQERHDDFPATVLETALIGRHPFLHAWQNESAEDAARAHQALDQLGIDHLAERPLATLSGGERQRVSIATVLTQSPDIWLVDEPTNHLDLHHQVEVMGLLDHQARSGRAVVMCLHDLNLAARWCDHLLLLYPDGTACWGPRDDILVTSTLERLYRQPLMTAEIDGVPVFLPRVTAPSSSSLSSSSPSTFSRGKPHDAT